MSPRKRSSNTRKEIQLWTTAVHVSRCHGPAGALPNTSILLLYISSICLTLNYLCPRYHPLTLSFSLCLTLFVPHFPFPLSPDVCSPAALRWLRGVDGTGFYRACAHTDTHIHTQSITEWPATAGIQDFCPRVSRFLSVLIFSTSFHCLWPHQYETDAPNSQVTADKHGIWSEKVRNLAVSLL